MHAIKESDDEALGRCADARTIYTGVGTLGTFMGFLCRNSFRFTRILVASSASA